MIPSICALDRGRDLLSNLTQDVSYLLHEDNQLEIQFFEYACELNKLMIEEWKRETNWDQ